MWILGAEAAIFLVWEYLFQIFGIGSLQCTKKTCIHMQICNTSTSIPSENVTYYDLTSFTWNPISNSFLKTLNVFLAFLSLCRNKALELKEEFVTTQCPNTNVSDLLSAWKGTVGCKEEEKHEGKSSKKSEQRRHLYSSIPDYFATELGLLLLLGVALVLLLPRVILTHRLHLSNIRLY
jgi:hypothetical protein